MKYMLLIYHDEAAWAGRTEDERKQIYGEYRHLIEDLRLRDRYLADDQLQPTSTASIVRVREGKPIITDGPFAETREQVGVSSWLKRTIFKRQPISRRIFHRRARV